MCTIFVFCLGPHRVHDPGEGNPVLLVTKLPQSELQVRAPEGLASLFGGPCVTFDVLVVGSFSDL